MSFSSELVEDLEICLCGNLGQEHILDIFIDILVAGDVLSVQEFAWKMMTFDVS